ncbi:nucleoside deaminase [Pseudaestuariivita rosea]|uniref:nucleoside deaminase n=1 Tax=Pseudaestuariivita rosea TaxID=2763263 RepID=UPI001F228222|nr:nucleoside deaminase [Pseudaestuariivita rosea]
MFRSFMDIALEEARMAADRGEVPVGAVLVDPTGQIVARDGNRTRELSDPTAHAEILVLRTGCQAAKSERLPGHDLYVTLEPCPMCATALSAARIARLYYGAPDPKSGGIAQGPRVFSHPQCHHVPEVYDGIGAHDAKKLLEGFFQKLRHSEDR